MCKITLKALKNHTAFRKHFITYESLVRHGVKSLKIRVVGQIGMGEAVLGQ